MKILILYRHFWPDSPPYASMLRSIASQLTQDGHDVTIWTQEPSYKQSDWDHSAARSENLDGIAIERFSCLPGFRRLGAVRILDKLLFPVRLLLKALLSRLQGRGHDLVWTATIPPVAQGMAGRWIAGIFGAKLLYHCQDLYPELGAHSGKWRAGGLADKLLKSIERRTRSRADILVALSDDMSDTVRQLASPRGTLAVINNFMLEDFSEAPSEPNAKPVERAEPAGPVRLIFAGNLGEFQGLDLLIEAMQLVEAKRQDVELVLMGDGKARAKLIKQSEGMRSVRFEEHRPFEEAQQFIAAADVGIVSLEPDIYRLAFPSKTLTYLGLNLPLLCVVEEQSNLAGMVADYNLGWTAPRDPQQIAAQIAQIAESRGELGAMREAIAPWFDTNLRREAILQRWSGLIAGIDPVGGAQKGGSQ